MRRLRELVHIKLNLEMAATAEMVGIACTLKPEMAMLVPEGRQEVTTEGGLDVAGAGEASSRARCASCADAGIVRQRVHRRRAPPGRGRRAHRRAVCEIHTGPYAHAFHAKGRDAESAAGRRRAREGSARRARRSARSACASTPATRSTTSTCSRSRRCRGVRELHIGHAIVSPLGVRRHARSGARDEVADARGRARDDGVATLARGPVMLDVDGLELTAEDRERLAHPPVGGVILFARNYAIAAAARRADANRSARCASRRSLIAVDHEGGRVQRFREGFTAIPPMRDAGRAVGARRRGALPPRPRAAAATIASELRAHGVDFSFTPVLDLDYGRSGVIGDRAFSRAIRMRSRISPSALIDGLHAGGCASGRQAFPGARPRRGRLASRVAGRRPPDAPRSSPPTSCRSRRWRKRARRGHARARRLSAVDPQPAGFSPFWLHEILRGRLRLRRHDLQRRPVDGGRASAGDIVARADAAAGAGCDVVLVCNDAASAGQLLEHWRPAG